MTTSSGLASLSARIACWTTPSSAKLSSPSGSFALGIPNRSTALMPSAPSSRASPASASTESWSIPGIDGIGARTPSPGTTKSG